MGLRRLSTFPEVAAAAKWQSQGFSQPVSLRSRISSWGLSFCQFNWRNIDGVLIILITFDIAKD